MTLPAYLLLCLDRYIRHQETPGHFLRCVLENDLLGAVKYGDPIHLAGLPELVRHLFSNAPLGCFGSKEAVAYWLNERDSGE